MKYLNLFVVRSISDEGRPLREREQIKYLSPLVMRIISIKGRPLRV